MEAETRYARSGDVSIAYQVTGDGAFDVVYVPPFVSHVELAWDVPGVAAFNRRLSSFCRHPSATRASASVMARQPATSAPATSPS